MAANLKGLGGIKGLALRHGEKIAIGGAALLALWFIYSSFSLPSLDSNYQADKLASEISATNRAIDESRWPDGPDSPGFEDIRKVNGSVAKNANFAVDADKYAIRGIDTRVVAPTVRRTDPVVLNAVDVKVYGNAGLLAFRDENTAAEQERRRRLKEEDQQKKQQEMQKRQSTDQANQEGGNRRNRRNADNEFGMDMAADPDHPNRRMVEGIGNAMVGVPLQGGERLDSAYWATIVAKVPIREQLKLFQDAFQNARGFDATRDFPQYVGFIVDRQDVVAGKPVGNWTRVGVLDGQQKYKNQPISKFVNVDTVTKLGERASAEWAGASMEPVDSRWTDMLLTMPLPPLVGRNFAEDATHPDIPLAVNAPPLEEEVLVQPDSAPAQPAGAADDDSFSAGTAAGPQQPMGGFMPARSPMGRFGGMSEFAGGPGGRFGGGEFGPMSRGMGGPEGGGYGGGGGIASGQRTTLPRGVDFLLLRFFDFSVEPGKEYQYRVKIVLNDPNAMLPLNAGVLANEVVDRRSKEIANAKAKGTTAPYFRLAEDWTQSGTVGIPTTGGLVHVAEARLPSPKVHNDEPAVKVFAETFDIDPADKSAIHVAREREFRRGEVVNIREKGMRYAGENDRWIDTMDNYALNTGFTVLDVEGGDKIGKLTAPTRVLFMDGAGNLRLRDEVTDKRNVTYLRTVFSEDKRKPRTDQPGGEFGGPRGTR